LGQIDDQELLTDFDEILFRVSKISGVDIKEAALDFDFLKEETIIYLKNFGYINLNLGEIILAFRFNCDTDILKRLDVEIEKIISKSKYLNVDYIVSVLKNYLQFRFFVDRKVQNIIDGY
jgi:hypothetical protein